MITEEIEDSMKKLHGINLLIETTGFYAGYGNDSDHFKNALDFLSENMEKTLKKLNQDMKRKAGNTDV